MAGWQRYESTQYNRRRQYPDMQVMQKTQGRRKINNSIDPGTVADSEQLSCRYMFVSQLLRKTWSSQNLSNALKFPKILYGLPLIKELVRNPLARAWIQNLLEGPMAQIQLTEGRGRKLKK